MDDGILLIGTGAQAKYALEIFHLNNRKVVGMIALEGESPPASMDGVDVLGNLMDFEKKYLGNNQPAILFCCSNNRFKAEMETKLAGYSPRYANAIHPAAVIARTAVLGKGIIINANAVIQPYARLGNHVMIHAGVVIEHDCVIGNYANLAPGVVLAGHVKVGKGAMVYTAAAVIPAIEIGDNAVVGAGAVVLKNVKNNATVVGCPAREIKKRKNESR